MSSHQAAFDSHVGVKKIPNQHELALFSRAQEYIEQIASIPGIEMIAVCNSLSMYATHEGSDIDLFIITEPHMLSIVRLLTTLRLWRLGVWRHGEEIAGNFCLSFFITTEAMDLEKIAIPHDIYLENWILHLKPIFVKNTTYDDFLRANSWAGGDEITQQENLRFLIEKRGVVKKTKHFWRMLNRFLAPIMQYRSRRHFIKLGKPEGVIITNSMLKFHDQDRRCEIRDMILGKNFDK